ncbi:hypothetical protein MC885_013533 [Smutsia gigantea]|nr:hypothetical protein MC885_013533 [Smutsia gigantea]
MVAYWRQAGLSYIRYSQICAKAVRDALKTEFRANAEKTSGSSVKIVKQVSSQLAKPALGMALPLPLLQSGYRTGRSECVRFHASLLRSASKCKTYTDSLVSGNAALHGQEPNTILVLQRWDTRTKLPSQCDQGKPRLSGSGGHFLTGPPGSQRTCTFPSCTFTLGLLPGSGSSYPFLALPSAAPFACPIVTGLIISHWLPLPDLELSESQTDSQQHLPDAQPRPGHTAGAQRASLSSPQARAQASPRHHPPTHKLLAQQHQAGQPSQPPVSILLERLCLATRSANKGNRSPRESRNTGLDEGKASEGSPAAQGTLGAQHRSGKSDP